MNIRHDEQILSVAQREVDQEIERALVDAMKARIYARKHRSFWSRLFPFTITITRKHT